MARFSSDRLLHRHRTGLGPPSLLRRDRGARLSPDGISLRGARARTPPAPRTDWAWFFDIDGTLVEIANTPWGIVVDAEMPRLIQQLSIRAVGAVALVTGRSIDAVDDLLSLSGMPIAGQHGLELRMATGERLTHALRAENLEHVRQHLRDAVERHPGLILEYKGLSLALHYRDAPRLASYAHRLVKSLREKYVPDFEIQKGKRVVELRPAGKDKGVAIREFMMDPPFAGRVPVFIGDDVTDEAAFEVVNEMGGHSIKIGPGKTHARWRLEDVVSLRHWLRLGLEPEA